MIDRNLWKNDLVAIAYSYQQKAPPYLELIQTMERCIDAKAGELWLDVGCGSGRLIESIWTKSSGLIRGVIGLDVSYKGLVIARKAVEKVHMKALHTKVHFLQADISKNLAGIRPNLIDGVTAGLCLSYAEHWNDVEKKWDKKALISLISEIHTVLREGGRLIFSTNIPKANFTLIALRSWKEILLSWKAPIHLLVSLIMLVQSRWLTHCVAIGRFHYLPANEWVGYLMKAGFRSVHYELTYAGQAWVFSALKKSP
jgi:SAM-dependent methyltransferase